MKKSLKKTSELEEVKKPMSAAQRAASDAAAKKRAMANVMAGEQFRKSLGAGGKDVMGRNAVRKMGR